jgi:hypothetical protein
MKIGRNHPCSCGSGKKYKYCCLNKIAPGLITNMTNKNLPAGLITAIAQMQAKMQRQKEWPLSFGAIPPIANSLLPDGTRMVAAGGNIYKSVPGETWHGFLYDHLQYNLGTAWFEAEAMKPREERHIIINWFEEICRKELGPEGRFTKWSQIEDTGATLAFRSLSYDLVCLLQGGCTADELIRRLKLPDQFEGARYEIWVIASFLRAGYSIEFEDESDRRTTHCEFTATNKAMGQKYSVEAKRRHRQGAGPEMPLTTRLDVQGLIAEALRKTAAHERIIFIDINMPPNPGSIVDAPWIKQFQRANSLLALQPFFRNNDTYKAHIMITNHPYHYVTSQSPDPKQQFFATSFNYPDLDKDGSIFPKAYPIVFDLMLSISNHFAIPEDFLEW